MNVRSKKRNNSIFGSDVCYGRRKRIMNYAGNERFKKIIPEYSPMYRESQINRNTKEQDDITTEVIRTVQRRGGRFFHEEKDQDCALISNQTLRENVKQQPLSAREKEKEMQVGGGDDIRIDASQKVSDRPQHNSQQEVEEEVNLEQEKSQEEIHIQLDDLIKWGLLSDEDESHLPA